MTQHYVGSMSSPLLHSSGASDLQEVILYFWSQREYCCENGCIPVPASTGRHHQGEQGEQGVAGEVTGCQIDRSSSARRGERVTSEAGRSPRVYRSPSPLDNFYRIISASTVYMHICLLRATNMSQVRPPDPHIWGAFHVPHSEAHLNSSFKGPLHVRTLWLHIHHYGKNR